MRYIGGNGVPPRSAVTFDLTLGPTVPQDGVKEFSVEQLEAAWRAYGTAIMDEWPRNRPGFRPWGFWQELGEHPEDHEAAILLLAERGLLYDEEVGVLAEQRRFWHINEHRWRTDPAAVALYERVREAQG